MNNKQSSLNYSEQATNTLIKSVARDVVENNLNTPTYKVGRIVATHITGSTIRVIVRKVDEDDYLSSDQPLFNNPMRVPEDKLSLYEVLIPLLNVSLDTNPVNPDTLINSFALVKVFDTRAVSAEYLGALDSASSSPASVKREHIIDTRLTANNPDDLEELIKTLVKTYDYDDDILNEVFKYTVEESLGKVLIYNGEGQIYKETDRAFSPLEKKLDVPEDAGVVGLNEAPMKTKLCHRFNRLFTGR